MSRKNSPPASELAPDGKKRNKRRGRPAHVPTEERRRQVRLMVGFGCLKQPQIAKVIGLDDEKTLRKYYRAEIDDGKPFVDHEVASNLYREATGSGPNAVRAAIFWMERRAGWWRPASDQQSGSATGRGVLLLPVTSATLAEWEQTVTHHSAPGGTDATA